MPNFMPTITIAIPTYNRPEGLRATLASIAKQTRLPDEVIVSDNAGPASASREVVESFYGSIPNLRYVQQETNLGAAGNFFWLLSEAEGRYFAWLADDDEYGSANLIEAILARFEHDPSARLVFPEVDVYYDPERTKWSKDIFSQVYGGCETDWDYLMAWNSSGAGQCYYGVYDREWLLARKPDQLLDTDLAYFGEGRFLHELFITGGVRFEPSVTFTYNGIAATKLCTPTLLKAFWRYSCRIHKLYLRTPKLTGKQKLAVFANLAKSHHPYSYRLARSALRERLVFVKRRLLGAAPRS